MVFQDLESLLMFLNFQAKLGVESDLLSDDLVKLSILIVGIGREVLVKVVLGDRVHDVVCHFLY